MKKQAYLLGVQMALQDSGLIKEAGLSEHELALLLAPMGLGATIGGVSSAMATRDPRGTLKGALVGGSLGAIPFAANRALRARSINKLRQKALDKLLGVDPSRVTGPLG